MISLETASSLISKLAKDMGKDPFLLSRKLSDFLANEPNVAAYISQLTYIFKDYDNTACSLIAMMLYSEMKRSQDSSDKLKDQTK